jgi:hypothetical protein
MWCPSVKPATVTGVQVWRTKKHHVHKKKDLLSGGSTSNGLELQDWDVLWSQRVRWISKQVVPTDGQNLSYRHVRIVFGL